MALYKLYQDKRQDIAGRTNPYYGKWYAKAVHLPKEVDTLELARRVQKNVSVKISDVYAVLREASDVINVALLSSERVKLDGIGSLKAALSSSPADSQSDFSVNKNIKMSRIIFTPELDPERTVAKSRKDKTLLRGIRWNDVAQLVPTAGGGGSIQPEPPTLDSYNVVVGVTVNIVDHDPNGDIEVRKGTSGNWTSLGAGVYEYTPNATGDYYFRQVVNGLTSEPSQKLSVSQMP